MISNNKQQIINLIKNRRRTNGPKMSGSGWKPFTFTLIRQTTENMAECILFPWMSTHPQPLIFSRSYHQRAALIDHHPDIHQSAVQNNWARAKRHGKIKSGNRIILLLKGKKDDSKQNMVIYGQKQRENKRVMHKEILKPVILTIRLQSTVLAVPAQQHCRKPDL